MVAEPYYELPHTDLYSVSADGGEARLINAVKIGVNQMSLSPDGKRRLSLERQRAGALVRRARSLCTRSHVRSTAAKSWRTLTESGGEQLFRALKFLKRPTAMVRFPGESHEFSRSGQPWHRVERLQAIVGWFDKYLMGRDVAIYRDVTPTEVSAPTASK